MKNPTKMTYLNLLFEKRLPYFQIYKNVLCADYNK